MHPSAAPTLQPFAFANASQSFAPLLPDYPRHAGISWAESVSGAEWEAVLWTKWDWDGRSSKCTFSYDLGPSLTCSAFRVYKETPDLEVRGSSPDFAASNFPHSRYKVQGYHRLCGLSGCSGIRDLFHWIYDLSSSHGCMKWNNWWPQSLCGYKFTYLVTNLLGFSLPGFRTGNWNMVCVLWGLAHSLII